MTKKKSEQITLKIVPTLYNPQNICLPQHDATQFDFTKFICEVSKKIKGFIWVECLLQWERMVVPVSDRYAIQTYIPIIFFEFWSSRPQTYFTVGDLFGINGKEYGTREIICKMQREATKNIVEIIGFNPIIEYWQIIHGTWVKMSSIQQGNH
jgi:hypothetical protein